MDTVTYPDPEVRRRLEGGFVSLQVDATQEGPEVDCYRPLWTPCFLFLDAEGIEADRDTGYLPPAEFLARLGLGAARVRMARREWGRAAAELRGLLLAEETAFHPEARYWLGVARYKSEGRPEPLLEEWETLLDRWPASRWALSAGFIRQR